VCRDWFRADLTHLDGSLGLGVRLVGRIHERFVGVGECTHIIIAFIAYAVHDFIARKNVPFSKRVYT
jgi:hypothetical protein